jgi:uncharacterized protein YbjT (DUF2867 family)
MMPDQAKRIPSSILIFGAAGRIGGPLAAFLQREVPQIRLRLATSHPAQADGLRRKYPSAEIVTANYFDLHSLLAAAADMEGVFVVTPSETDERPAMTNLVEALKSSGCAVHILRIVGILPEFNPRRIPKALRDHGLGLQIQHPIAKAILDESDLPVTYLNIGATYMDNFIRMGEGIRKKRTLIWPERLIPYIDPREVGEV